MVLFSVQYFYYPRPWQPLFTMGFIFSRRVVLSASVYAYLMFLAAFSGSQ
jgi:hypothetical protein